MSLNSWKEYKLGELCKKVTSGGTPLRSRKEYYENGKIPWLKTKEVANGRIYTTENYISEIGLANSSAKLIPQNSIIIAMYGDGETAGRVAINKIPLSTNQACCNLIINEGIADYEYIYYYLLNSYDYLVNLKLGSGQQNLSATIIKNVSVQLPTLDYQKKLVSILSSLDDKIELNRQTNQTLEAIAQALFKEWFVDFNFPGATGEMEESELGEIPKGWRVGKLGDVLTVKGGTTPSTKVADYWDGEYYWATPKDLSTLQFPVLLNTERKLTEKGINQISSGVLPEGTLLLSSRAPIGYLAITDIPVSINQGFIAINGGKLSNIFLLYWLRQNMDKVVGRANGSTFLEISKTVFKEIEIMFPNKELVATFDKNVLPLFELIKNNEKQNQTIIQLRDSLLPKLMKGEIAVT
ncbi:restriction endonuclease subunit S [Foetidibacter luteolus]|uniref:restriction endonuclease subunit S n=1 Tax=Foetidibacter luteolus TaxID=2608880 RepID=UPI001A990ED0|nr:restriction endonuclease subunit S [Foetidibacter luteolus]